ncbi:MAG TPA: hypothetical protein EYN38_06325 [Flavobacteriales bacterium]|nr:hypothetical protein [Flavobacteriales bacterium]
MKNILICLIVSILSGCTTAAVTTDFEYARFDGPTILIDTIPTIVSIVQIDDVTYDVLSREEGVAISRIYSHKAFVNRDRYRRAAITVLQKRLGKRKQLTIIDDVGTGTGMWIRFKVTDK